MKKLQIIVLFAMTLFILTGCGNKKNDTYVTTESPEHITSEEDITEPENSEKTEVTSEQSVKLLGDIIPEPAMQFDIINGSSEYVYLEVKNATEDDFRSYVESCKPYGFDGYIKSAESPDFYFKENNADGYLVEVRYEKDDQKYTVYVSPPLK